MDNFDRLSAMLVQHEVLTPEPPGAKSKSRSTKRGPKRPARRGHLAMAAMLAERGVLVWYDAEGDFMNPGAHARVVMAAAKCARLGKVSIEDRYVEGKGRLMSLRLGGLSPST